MVLNRLMQQEWSQLTENSWNDGREARRGIKREKEKERGCQYICERRKEQVGTEVAGVVVVVVEQVCRAEVWIDNRQVDGTTFNTISKYNLAEM